MNKYFSGYFNLLKTTVGSGILSYPFIFKTYGFAIATIISVVAASISFFGLLLYLFCMQKIGPGSTFSSLAIKSYLKSSMFSNLIICLKCIGVAISYLVIIRQLLPIIFKYFVPSVTFITPKIYLLLHLLLISPLAYLNEISKLKYTSICGLLCIVIVICVSFYRYLNVSNISEDVVSISPITISWITGIGKVIFSFTCHQNIFSVHNELRDRDIKKSSFLALYTVLTALFVYLIFGYLNYFVYGSLVNVNILETYPEDKLTILMQVLYVIVMGFSYPLQIHPCKFYMIQMIGVSENKNIKTIEIIITTALLLVTYIVAASGINLGTVYSLIGSLASSLVCMIFPVIFYKSIMETDKRINFFANVTLMIGFIVFASSIFNIGIFNTSGLK